MTRTTLIAAALALLLGWAGPALDETHKPTTANHHELP